MYALIGLAGLFGFFVFLVVLVVQLIRRKPKKVAAIGILVCFAMFVIAVSLSPEPDTESGAADKNGNPTSGTSAETPSKPDNAPIPPIEPTVEPTLEPTPEPTTESAEPELIEISAADLWSAYEENPINADNLYKDQTLSITGTISDITQDIITKKPCVVLDAGDTYGLYGIQCFFPGDDETNTAIAELRDGQTITVIGKCKGVPILQVQISDCSLPG